MLYLLDFVFFVYSGAPRMSPAVKVARIVSTLLRFARDPSVAAHDRERIEMRVRRELIQQLRRASRAESPSVVTATLLDCLSDLGDSYQCSQAELAEWFGFESVGNRLEAPREMSALLLFSIILHIRDRPGFRQLRAACLRWALGTQSRDRLDAERALVALNLLTCPWVSPGAKAEILKGYGSTFTATPYADQRDHGWNINWSNFDLYAALQNKRLYEVY